MSRQLDRNTNTNDKLSNELKGLRRMQRAAAKEN